MFKDCLPNETPVFIGDIAYVYPYTKRNQIKTFDDLNKIIISNIIPKTKLSDPIMVEGITKLVKDDIYQEEKILGMLEYTRKGNIVNTADGEKFINFYLKDGEIHRCLRKPKNEYEYCRLLCVFQVAKKIEIKIEPYDLLCLNQENLLALIQNTKITYPRLHNGHISYFLNKKNINNYFFDIYINNIKYEGEDGPKKIFEWACQNKNSINDVNYDFNKIFSLKTIRYEMINCPLL